MPGRPKNALRVLLVTTSDEELRTLGLQLHRDGIAVTRVRDAASAAEALHASGYDAGVVSHPLPDADVIASCAMLSAIPGAPPLLLLDALDPNEQTIPATIRPARMLRKPVDAGKLAAEVREMVEADEPSPAQPVNTPLDLAAALLELAGDRRTGVLEVRGDELRTRIFLRDGAVSTAEGGSLRETLGRMLLRHGTLSEADYTRVIERMTDRVMANENQRMGEVLIELGMLSGAEVHRALRDQVLEKVTACFAWAQPSWSFEELDRMPEGIEPFSLPPSEALVWTAVRRHVRPETVALWLAPRFQDRPRLSQPPAAVQERLRLEGSLLRLAERIDGTRSVAELSREAPEAPALLAMLLLTGALADGAAGAAGSTAPRARPRGPSVPFAREVVGRRRDPGATGATPASETASADRSKARLEAEQWFRRGRQLLDAEKPLEAVKLLRRALELEPGEPEYAMTEAWASFLEAKHLVRVARAKALSFARRLLETDPKAAKAHTILGRLALEEGDKARATREFELALLRDPEDEEARRGIKQARG